MCDKLIFMQMFKEALKKGLVSRASGFVSREESGGWLDEDDDWGGGNRSGGLARMD